MDPTSVLPRVIVTPIAPTSRNRKSGSSGPVCTTASRASVGRTTASCPTRTVVRLLLRKSETATASPSATLPTSRTTPTSARRGVVIPGSLRRGPEERSGGGERRGVGSCWEAGLRDRVEGDRGGHTGVEGLQLPGHRDRDDLVAGLGDQAAEAGALGADDHDQRPLG